MANAAFIVKAALADVWVERVTIVEGPEWVVIEVFFKALSYSHMNRKNQAPARVLLTFTISVLISFFMSVFMIIV